jgi:hypothetical protein
MNSDYVVLTIVVVLCTSHLIAIYLKNKKEIALKQISSDEFKNNLENILNLATKTNIPFKDAAEQVLNASQNKKNN